MSLFEFECVLFMKFVFKKRWIYMDTRFRTMCCPSGSEFSAKFKKLECGVVSGNVLGDIDHHLRWDFGEV